MTSRHAGYVVHLAEDVREDDSEAVISALKMIKGVADVTPVRGGDVLTAITDGRRDRLWMERLEDLARSVTGLPARL